MAQCICHLPQTPAGGGKPRLAVENSKTLFNIQLLTMLIHLYTIVSRTNSDSALHQSAMNPTQQDAFVGGSQELQPKRGKYDVKAKSRLTSVCPVKKTHFRLCLCSSRLTHTPRYRGSRNRNGKRRPEGITTSQIP